MTSMVKSTHSAFPAEGVDVHISAEDAGRHVRDHQALTHSRAGCWAMNVRAMSIRRANQTSPSDWP